MPSISTEWVRRTSTGIPRAGAGGHACQGAYYAPEGSRPKVAFIATHPNIDFSEHYLAPLLAARGFGFLGWNTRFRGDEAHFLTDHAVSDIAVGTRWLREEAGVETLVLLGNSGGGSLMAAYQSQALEPVLEPAPGLRLAKGLDDLPLADLYVSLAAHPGRHQLFANTMDPSVVDEHDPIAVDPELDMYDRPAPFDDEFRTRYRTAQVERSRRITSWALAELDRIRESDAPASDRLFAVSRLWADLRFLDATIDPNDRRIGTCWLGDARKANYGVFGIGQVSTLRTWINMWSLEHSQGKGEVHLPKITQPSLVIGALGDSGIFPSDAEMLFNWLGSGDKELTMVAGDHYLNTPDDARDNVADLIGDWVGSHS